MDTKRPASFDDSCLRRFYFLRQELHRDREVKERNRRDVDLWIGKLIYGGLVSPDAREKMCKGEGVPKRPLNPSSFNTGRIWPDHLHIDQVHAQDSEIASSPSSHRPSQIASSSGSVETTKSSTAAAEDKKTTESDLRNLATFGRLYENKAQKDVENPNIISITKAWKKYGWPLKIMVGTRFPAASSSYGSQDTPATATDAIIKLFTEVKSIVVVTEPLIGADTVAPIREILLEPEEE